jgi:hypothetical protein
MKKLLLILAVLATSLVAVNEAEACHRHVLRAIAAPVKLVARIHQNGAERRQERRAARLSRQCSKATDATEAK